MKSKANCGDARAVSAHGVIVGLRILQLLGQRILSKYNQGLDRVDQL